MKFRWWPVATLLLTALLFGGCSDDGDDGASGSDLDQTADPADEDGALVLPFTEWQAEVNELCSERLSRFFTREPNADVAIYLEGMFTGIVDLNEALELIAPPDQYQDRVEAWHAVHHEQATAIESGIPDLRAGRVNSPTAVEAMATFQEHAPENEELVIELGVDACLPNEEDRQAAIEALTEAATVVDAEE